MLEQTDNLQIRILEHTARCRNSIKTSLGLIWNCATARQKSMTKHFFEPQASIWPMTYSAVPVAGKAYRVIADSLQGSERLFLLRSCVHRKIFPICSPFVRASLKRGDADERRSPVLTSADPVATMRHSSRLDVSARLIYGDKKLQCYGQRRT